MLRYYIPDLVIEFESGHKRIIEAKGYLRPGDMVKMVAVKKQHPDLDIRIVFQRDNKLPRTKVTRYSDWANRHSIPCAIGSIPEDWYIE